MSYKITPMDEDSLSPGIDCGLRTNRFSTKREDKRNACYQHLTLRWQIGRFMLPTITSGAFTTEGGSKLPPTFLLTI